MIVYVCLHLTRNQFLKKKKAQSVSNAWYVKIGCFYLKSFQMKEKCFQYKNYICSDKRYGFCEPLEFFTELFS